MPTQSAELSHPQLPKLGTQSGVVPAHVITSIQPVSVELQTCSTLPEHWCSPALHVAATQVPLEQTGIAGVPEQSLEPEQPQIPVEV